MTDEIGIIGAGAWGTALATVTAAAGNRVTLWAREPDIVSAINDGHENPLFLSGITLDPGDKGHRQPCRSGERRAVARRLPGAACSRHVESASAKPCADHIVRKGY